MVAIGVLMMFLAGMFSLVIESDRGLETASFVFLCGFTSTVLGVCFWLWEVMP